MSRVARSPRAGDRLRCRAAAEESPRSRLQTLRYYRDRSASGLLFSLTVLASLFGASEFAPFNSVLAEPSSGFEFQYYGPMKKYFQGGLELGAAARVGAFERAAQEHLRWKRPGTDLNQFGRVLVMPVKESSKEMTMYYWRPTGIPTEGWIVRLDLDATVQSAEMVHQLPPDVSSQIKVGQTVVFLAFPGGVRKTLAALAESAKARGGIPPKAIVAQQNFRVFYSAQIRYGVALHYPLGTSCRSWAVEFNEKAEPVEGREVAESRC